MTTDIHLAEHEEGLMPGADMWERYMSDPDAEPDPAGWGTLVCWPVADGSTDAEDAESGG